MNNSYMRFTVNTRGYPYTLNIMINISNVEIGHDGVTVPYTSEDDGIVFTATNNTTYELRSVSSSPVANFTSNLTSGNVPFTVQFNDTSTGSPDSWDWNFGDETYSNIQNATHTFTTVGLYNVTLTASKSGSSSTITRAINVSEKPFFPAANFTANTTEGTAPLTVKFTDISTNSPNGWKWNFGDESTSTEQSPEHVFSDEGTYHVTLVATNGDGSSDEKSMNITVTRVSTPPVADFTADKTEGTTPLTVTFTDTSTNSPTGWEWNFGDGTNSTDTNPSHTYATAGTFTAKLTASNADGTNTTSKIISVTKKTIKGSPKAIFTSTPRVGRAPLTVKFTDKSINTASIRWDFGDKSEISTESKPAHTYKTTGFYIVKLTATNGDKSNVAAKIVIVTGGRWRR
jgi:PKD repeat protein